MGLLSNLVLVALMARWLGPVPVGWYGGTMAFVGLVLTATNLGVGAVMGREVARRPERTGRYLAHALLLRTVFTVPATFVLAWLGAALFLEETPLTLALLITAYALVTGTVTLLYTLFMSAGAFGRFFAVNAPLKVTGVVAAFLVLGNGGGLALLIAVLLALAVLALVVLASLARPLVARGAPFKLRRRFALALARRSLPLAPAAVAEFTSLKADQTLLLAMVGGAATGLYHVATQLYLALLMAPLALTKAYLPRFTRLQQVDGPAARTLLLRYVGLFLGLSAVTAALALTLGERVIVVAFGEDFRSAAGILAALTPALFLTALNRLYNHSLIGLGENRWYLVVSASGAAFNVLGNLALVPRWGVYGAALMTVLTEGLVLAASWWRVNRRLAP